MRVFSQINNCQQKQNKKTKQKTDKTKRGAPLLGLAKSIYYYRAYIFTFIPLLLKKNQIYICFLYSILY